MDRVGNSRGGRGPAETDPSAGIAAINVGMLALLAALQEMGPADDRLAGGTLR